MHKSLNSCSYKYILMDFQNKLYEAVRDVPDFPKPGIIFKDITPILKNQELCSYVLDELENEFQGKGIDAVAGIESRGFLFGMGLANRLNVPFIPIRKAGKLPYSTYSETYELEYGSAEIEIHTDALDGISKVLIHDDLLATGGTAEAAAKLIGKHAAVAGFSFLIDLEFLNGEQKLKQYSNIIHSLLKY